MEFFKEKLLSINIEDVDANVWTYFVATAAGDTFFNVNRLTGIGPR
jgi:hypothetical protein